MNQIDKMLGNIMGSSKKKSKNNNMFDFSKIVSPIKSTNGASINMENMWKGFSPMQKNQMRLKFPDSDGDRIPDRFDCSPFNVMRQDSGKKAIPVYSVQWFNHDTKKWEYILNSSTENPTRYRSIKAAQREMEEQVRSEVNEEQARKDHRIVSAGVFDRNSPYNNEDDDPL